MKKAFTGWSSLLAALFVLTACFSTAEAASTATEILGEIEHLTLNTPADIYSGGVMIVGGHEVILPRNLLIDLPANRLSLQQLFDQAPAACKALGESGLAKADKCNASGTGGFATLSGVHSNAGNVIAADVLINKGNEVASGVVSYINYTDGYFRVNGMPGSATTGVMVRLNDPTSRHTVQQGLGCSGGPNCSADPRFTLDPDNYVIAFSSGYPVCIPSTVSRTFTSVAGLATSPTQSSATGTGDALCPDTNRTPGVLVEPPVNDSRLFAPLLIGDSVNAKGNYETVNGTRFLSVHTMKVSKALSTKNLPTQPDYMFLSEVFVEAPGFQNQRARMLIIGFTTLAPTDVDFWTLHRDPATNSVHEFPLASIKGCDNAAGAGTCGTLGLAAGAAGNIFRIRYDVDFLLAAGNKIFGGALAKLSPCLQLQASPRFAASNPQGLCPGGATVENNFGIMSPIPHEIQARTGHSLDNPGLITLDINGKPATNGQYLFPFGINLGGIETADFLEVNINLLNTPRVFEGIPWNLDRRLSPSGCLAGGCEATPQPLDPFPYTGLDPRFQAIFIVGGAGGGGTPAGQFNNPIFTASLLTHVYDRVFSFVDPVLNKFNGNASRLPYVLGTFPADPGPIAINTTPVLNLFAPVAVNDTVFTNKGIPVTIDVLANDVPVMGAIDRATVKIVSSNPANGTPTVNFGGTITYAPLLSFAGTDSFTYTVANNLGGISNAATVTVTVAAPPVAVNDTATAAAGTQIGINVIANDTSASSNINPTSVNVVSPPTCGTVFNPANGTLLFTAPASVPAGLGTCTFSYVVSDSLTPPQISPVATVTVTIIAGNLPVANNDTAATTVGSTIAIDVLANDTTTLNPINTASVVLNLPAGVTASFDSITTKKVNYTAPVTPGVYTFSYTVKDNTGLVSNAAIVTVTVTSIPPTANIFTVNPVFAGAITSIPIVPGHVTQGSSLINPASLAVTQPVNGAALAFADGTVAYTSTPGFTGTDTFTYTVRDTLGTLSNSAIVTLNVTAPTEVLTVTNAQFIVSGATWLIEGTSTTHTVGGSVDIYNNTAVGTGAGDPTFLGTVPISTVDGTWTLLLPNSLKTPNVSLQISVKSSNGASLTGVTLVVR